MRCGWGPYFRRTFEVQAGNSPLQGQSKPPAKLVVLIMTDFIQKTIYQRKQHALGLRKRWQKRAVTEVFIM